MHALLVTTEPPSLDRAGGGTHAFIFAMELLARGWQVTVVAELAEPGDEPRIRALGQLGIPVYTGRWNEWMGDAYLEDPGSLIADAQFDLAVVQSWFLGERFGPILRSRSPRTKLIVDMGDLFLLRLVRTRFGGGRRPRALSERDVAEFVKELNAYAAADAVLAVSDKERELVDLFCRRPGLTHLLPLSREVREDTPGFADRSGLVFVGSYNHPPNAEAARFMCEEVMPLIPAEVRAEHPFSAVGYRLDPPLADELLEHEHVVPVGWVPELEPYLDRARIFVAPLLTGAGVKNKLLDAFSGGLPVITTTVGIEGMSLADGRDVVVADGPEALASAIAGLLADEERWNRIAAGGREWLRNEHNPAATSRAFWGAVEAVLGTPAPVG